MNAPISTRWLAVPLALALATLACQALSGDVTETPSKKPATPTPAKAKAMATEAEPTATRPPRPTKTPQATQPPRATPTVPAGPGDVIYFTDFDNLEGWTTIFALPESEDYIAEIRRGTLYLEVDARDTTVYAFYDFDLGQPDVRIDADVETVAGPNRNNISLVCRATGDGWYEFSMNSGGFWFIWRYDEDGFTSLAEGASRAIHLQKAKNHLAAVCEGETLTLYINDVEVGSTTDGRFTEGQVGVSVTTFDIKGAGVEFDWLAVSLP